LALPPSFEWDDCNVTSNDVLDEVHDLLVQHYVEDDDNLFRFAYSRAFLRWALMAPGYKTSWMCGVRASPTTAGKKGKLLGFISAIPTRMSVTGTDVDMVEINFLCVHKKLRSKRLAPVLIKEITRRVNLCGIWQAVYTAGVLLPKPVAECQYWHRPLNPKKLIAVGFSAQHPRRTMAKTIKLYEVPAQPTVTGVRQMEERDVAAVTSLLGGYLERFKLAPKFTEQDVSHWLVHQEGVVSSYVIEDGDGTVTDFFSFYTLPSTVIGNAEYSELKAAYMFYMVPGKHGVEDIMRQVLILAKSSGHDVVNALDLMEMNERDLFERLKFGPGDGTLHFYLFNWRVQDKLEPGDIGLVML
jgi:glycylpeptide N-tetradecanoyltransferase